MTGRSVDALTWYVEVGEEGAGDPDVLQFWHELAVEAAHGVSGEEPGGPGVGLQVTVDPLEVGQQAGLGRVVLLEEHHLELAEHVLDQVNHLLVLHEQVVAPGDLEMLRRI